MELFRKTLIAASILVTILIDTVYIREAIKATHITNAFAALFVASIGTMIMIGIACALHKDKGLFD